MTLRACEAKVCTPLGLCLLVLLVLIDLGYPYGDVTDGTFLCCYIAGGSAAFSSWKAATTT